MSDVYLDDLFENMEKEERREETIVIVNDSGLMTDEEWFSLILSGMVSDKSHLLDVLHGFLDLDANKLIGQIRKAVKNPDKYWPMVDAMGSLSEQEKKLRVAGARSIQRKNVFASIQRLLWDLGEGVFDGGLALEKLIHPDDAIALALEDTRGLVLSAMKAKRSDMKNGVLKIIDCLSPRVASSLKTDSERVSFVETLLERFVEGNLGVEFDSTQYRFPKESGALNPHTMSPKEWVGDAVAALFRSLMGHGTLVMFRSKDINDVRRYDPDIENNYLLFSDDPESPYHWSSNPAIYCNQVREQDNQKVWAWRADQSQINLRVNLAVQQENDNSHEFRQIVRKSISKTAALTYVKGKLGIKWSTELKILGIFYSGEQENPLAVKHVVRFYKRGLSKLGKVLENPEYIHIVAETSAKDLDPATFYQLMLPDFHSIVLIPMGLWKRSRVANQSSLYASPFGMKRPNVDGNPFNAYFALFGMAHVKEMFDCWKNNREYSYENYTHKLIKVAATTGSYPNLLAGTAYKASSRKKAITLFTRVFPGMRVGMILSPNSTKVGKTGKAQILKNAGFAREIDEYSFGTEVNGKEGGQSGGYDDLLFESDDLGNFDFFDSSDEEVYPPEDEGNDDDLSQSSTGPGVTATSSQVKEELASSFGESSTQ